MSSPTTTEQGTTLEQLRNSLTTYMETIARVPIELFESEHFIAENEKKQLIEEGALPVFLPARIQTEKETAEATYFALAALNAARARYGQGFEREQLRTIYAETLHKGKKLFGKQNPVQTINKEYISNISGTGYQGGETSGITHHFAHSGILKQLIELCELGRITNAFYQDYPGAQERIGTLYSGFYEREISIASEHQSSATVFDLIIRRLGYELITGTPTFDEQQKQQRTTKINTLDERVQLHLETLREHTRPLQQATATIHTSIEQAINTYFALYEKMRTRELSAPEKSHKVQPKQLTTHYEIVNEKAPVEEQLRKNKQLKQDKEVLAILTTTEEITAALKLADDKYSHKGNPAAFETRAKLDIEGVPTYHEWNEEQKRFLERYAHVQELSTPLPLRQKKIFPYPALSPRTLSSLQSRFEQLKPQEETIIRGRTAGIFDPRAYANYFTKLLAGEPAKPTYYCQRERNERSVATLILLDISQSTGKLITREHTILDKMKEAVHYIALATRSCDDAVAIYAVTSEPDFFRQYDASGPTEDKTLGKLYRQRTVNTKRVGERVTAFLEVQRFDEPLTDEELRTKLSRLEPQRNNRDGAIIRHGTRLLTQRPEQTKLLLYINDGAPEDKRLIEPTPEEVQLALREPSRRKTIEQKYEGRYAWADTIKAVEEATSTGITPLIVRVGSAKDVPYDLLRRAGAHFRNATQDLSNLITVTAEAYLQLGA